MPAIIHQRFDAWFDGRRAQECALRLMAYSSCLYPTDQELHPLYSEVVVPDLLGLALHGRRCLERFSIKDTSVADWGFFPASRQSDLADLNLLDSFSHILHATRIDLGWERFEGEVDLYRGREVRFLGHVECSSDNGELKFPLGRLASSYLRGAVSRLADDAEGHSE